ncbi:MAG: hypothetical protein KJ626_01230, partial [Verrucomicrobia bacterium]|nr:hypothetical protein [Verrucomicrobiota bacterium]
LSLMTGSPKDTLKKAGKDVVFALVKELINHPEKHARKVASTGYKIGLDAYRENYALYRTYKDDPSRMPPEVAEVFYRNWYAQKMMEHAKNS